MLRLSPIIGLREELAFRSQSIEGPPYLLTKPSYNGRDQEINSFTIIGHERSGLLIVAETDDLLTQEIYHYDFGKKKLEIIYKHPEKIQLVGCSVNEERTLIAFTIKRRVPNNYAMEDLYESFIGELHVKGGCYPMGVRTNVGQRVKFLWSDVDNPNTLPKKSMAYFLYFFEEIINLYQVTYKSRPDGGVKITVLPTLKSVLGKPFTWCEWDAKRGYLYVIMPRPSKQGANKSTQEFMLRCFSFPDKKPSIFEKEEKDVTLVFETCLFIRLHNSKMDPLYLNSFNLNSYLTPVTQFMKIVHMRQNALCLCHQHKYKPDSKFVDVSIYMLHSKLKLDLQVPIPWEQNSQLEIPRILFETIGDMLLIFIPGFFLQLVDCGQDHGPCPGIVISDQDHLPVLPGYKLGVSPVATNFDVLPLTDVTHGPDLKGHTFLECRTGVVYEISFDLENFWKIFELDEPELHIETLHLAIIHIQDVDLVKSLMMYLFHNSPQNAAPGIFTEYITGSSYFELTQRLRVMTESRMERVIPITGIEMYNEYVNSFKGTKELKISPINNYSILPGGGAKSPIREKDDERRLSFPGSNSQRNSALPPLSPTPSPGVRRFFKDLLGLEDINRGMRTSSKTEKDFLEESRKWAIEVLQAQLLAQFPKEKATCAFIATEYPKIQQLQVENLFRYIENSSENRNEIDSFRLWENFASSLQELRLPHPATFTGQFIRLGYKCLPRGYLFQVESSS
eukprot:TRINITY_DN4846_c0_g1_i2.p1 TRINITY_DN4846_c0_g1~~TRINITY_DN4846_c0_g1_i2.p1  ORF type:complete len:734 (-),score=252.26 TRINITY_DN4846_c0_g1_i2:289-2490(-)